MLINSDLKSIDWCVFFLKKKEEIHRVVTYMQFLSMAIVWLLYCPGSKWMLIGFSGTASVTRRVADAMVSADAALDSRARAMMIRSNAFMESSSPLNVAYRCFRRIAPLLIDHDALGFHSALM